MSVQNVVVLPPALPTHFISSQETPQNFMEWGSKILITIISFPCQLVIKINELIKEMLFPILKNILVGGLRDSKTHIAQRIQELQKRYDATPVSLTAQDRVILQGMHFLATSEPPAGYVRSQCNNPSLTSPTVLLCVGNDHSVFHESYEELIKAYLARGINVMCFDYREIGLSSGTYSEKGSYNDAEVALEYLERIGAPKSNIFVEGYSMGSGPATHIAATNPEVKLLLRCPFAKTSLVADKALQEQKASLPLRYFVTTLVDYLLHYDNVAKIHRVTSTFGLIAVKEDRNLGEATYHHAERLIDAYQRRPQPQSLVYQEIDGSNHFLQYSQDERMAAALDNFLLRIRFIGL